jgi:hypothetical protein
MRRAALLVLLFACSSHQVGNVMGAGVSTGAGVATATAVALAASAGSRLSGGCYAICQQGEVCNERSGLCEALPCHGNCAGGMCEETFFGEKCIGGAASVVAQPSAAPSKKPAVRILDKPPVPDGALPGPSEP